MGAERNRSSPLIDTGACDLEAKGVEKEEAACPLEVRSQASTGILGVSLASHSVI